MSLRNIALFSTLLLVAASSHAVENWQALSLTTTPQNAPKVVAAVDKFMASAAGKSMPGTLSLMAMEIDGNDPATHSFITSMPSMAAREKWVASLQDNADWIALRDTVASLGELGATSRMAFLKNWGDEGNANVYWVLFGTSVTDAAGYLKAMDTLMGSETGKGFPGSLYLSGIMAAGMTPASHIISVGYESATEAEAWNEKMQPSADWAAFQKSIAPISELQGIWILRTVKTWGETPAE